MLFWWPLNVKFGHCPSHNLNQLLIGGEGVWWVLNLPRLETEMLPVPQNWRAQASGSRLGQKKSQSKLLYPKRESWNLQTTPNRTYNSKLQFHTHRALTEAQNLTLLCAGLPLCSSHGAMLRRNANPDWISFTHASDAVKLEAFPKVPSFDAARVPSKGNLLPYNTAAILMKKLFFKLYKFF